MRRVVSFSVVVVVAGVLVGVALEGTGWAVVPANDDFASATTISGASGCQAGSNVGGSLEAGEPGSGGDSVWYSWTAPSTASVTFRTYLRSMGDSTLGVYTGSAVNALTQVAANDDFYAVASRVDFSATMSTTYHIRVASFSAPGEDGTFALDWGGGCPAPSNDNFASATSISGASGSLASQTNEAATLQSGELDTHNICTDYGCGTHSDLGGTSVWYSWTAPSDIDNFDVCLTTNANGVGFGGPVIGVYTGSLGSLTEVAFSDTGNSLCTAIASFSATNGTTYMIGVGGTYGDSGGFDLSWGDKTPPTVSIARGASQTSPTATSPVTFDVTFSEAVTGFTNSDVDLSASDATTGTVTVTDTGDHIHYTVDVVVSSTGHVWASIPAAVAQDAASNDNTASPSAAVVLYDITAPVMQTLSLTVHGPKLTATFSATDVGSGVFVYECQIDSGGYNFCSSGDAFQVPAGSHTFYVRADDYAANVGTPVSQAFTIKSKKVKV